jgi:CRP/FNR family transcriptional regulator, cyclic AMP receptor protein
MAELEAAKRILFNRGWLARLPAPVQQRVVERSTMRKFEAGQNIYHAGDRPGGMYGVATGAVAIVLMQGDEGPSLAHIGRPGFWFGVGGAIVREPRRVGAVARGRSTTLYVPADALDDMVAADPGVWRLLTLNIVLNLDIAMRAHSDLLIRDPVARVAAVLIRIASNGVGSSDAFDRTPIDITQSELAELTALSRNGLGRVLSRLARAELIATGYGRITILAPNAMESLSNGRRFDSLAA